MFTGFGTGFDFRPRIGAAVFVVQLSHAEAAKGDFRGLAEITAEAALRRWWFHGCRF